MLIEQKTLSITHRLRRNRQTEALRNMVRETHLKAADLIAPLFVMEGVKRREEIPSMPGIARLSVDLAIREAASLQEQGIQAIALFPSLSPDLKSDGAEEAWNPTGLLPRSIRAIKQALPQLCLITDIALDPFTSHGHDGLANVRGEILNDPTVECLCKMAIVQAEAGADFVAPSDMMDGRVGAIRSALDEAGHQQTGILAYSIKYASSLYSPFRDAVRSQLQFGDKKTYQLDPGNCREALLEAALDEEEGADILMVKPAGFYLDVIAKLRAQTNRPIAAYQVSGEYAMVMAAAEMKYLNAEKVFYEALLSIKRAGADLIFTYAAPIVLPLL